MRPDRAAIANLKWTLFEESLIVAAVCIIFLMHVRSALVAILTAADRHPDRLHRHARDGHGQQHHEPGGIAIAIGAMVDAAIVMIENAHKHLERLPEEHPTACPCGSDDCRLPGRSARFVLSAADHHRVLPAGVHAGGQEGRLFSPLAYTKPSPRPVRRCCR